LYAPRYFQELNYFEDDGWLKILDRGEPFSYLYEYVAERIWSP
jgi:hypothetical protein